MRDHCRNLAASRLKRCFTDSARVSGPCQAPLTAYGSEPMSPSKIVAGSQHDAPTHPELEGRRVFLSGIDGGTGELIASHFARQRTRLVLHSCQAASSAAAFADSLKPQALSVRLFSGAVGTDQAASERLARAALGAFGGLDLVINLVGARNSGSPNASGTRDYEDDVADDLRSALVVSRAVADHARNSGQGASIMHVCLTRSKTGREFARYAMLKTAIESMAQDQARRWFSHDICVYAFVPGIAGDPFEDCIEADNVVPAHANFDSALCSILLNAAGGRSRWLNGVTVAIPV